MDMIGVVVALVLIGVALYLVNQYIPMAPQIKNILNVVVVVFVCLWVLSLLLGYGRVYLPRR